MKDNNKTEHWVGQAKSKTLDTDDFFKRKYFFDDVQDSSTGTTFEQSASGRKKNPYLLQEDKEQ